MYAKPSLTILFFLTFLQFGKGQFKGDKIFDSTVLHELRITSDTEPDLYDQIQMEAWDFDRPYHLVKMEFDGEEIDSVGIRAKGFFSSSDMEQTPMKIDINEYIDDQTFDGIKKFGLTNSFLDDFRQKDRIAYELCRRAGIASPRTAYVEVYVNDEFINIYLLVEQIDKTFIKQNFSDLGSLMKIYDLKYGDDVFFDFTDAPSEERLDKVDLRNYFKFLLINLIIRAEDNYPGNNFYIYYSEKENLFHYMPWDYNLSMSVNGNNFSGSLTPAADEEGIWNNPDMKSIYLEVACELYNYLLDDDYLENLVQSNESIILSNSQGATVVNASPLLAFLKDRRQWIKNQLDVENFNCNDFTYPHQIGDLVINEFVAKSDSIAGVQEPDGGTPDWIELYNNSNEDIILDHHFYLSDDIDFPKKWNFQSPVTIPANGYQIIWADRDVHQQGVHSNFKIEKSGGDLILVYEDMTIIDQVTYEEQELNQGYARVPNGTGAFTIQDHTFNANNEMTLSISSINVNSSIRICPNPTSDFFNIKSNQAIQKIIIFNPTGQEIFREEKPQGLVNISSLPAGIFYVQIHTDHHFQNLKLVKP